MQAGEAVKKKKIINKFEVFQVVSRVGGSRAKTLGKDVKVLKSFSISMIIDGQ